MASIMVDWSVRLLSLADDRRYSIGMARALKLKVFRMPVGFHDAYVAAPSQKAAIEAWGADKDVFRRGQAELVDDPALAEEPLASPGTVVKRLRGTAAEQIAALGEGAPADPASRRKPGPGSDARSGRRPTPGNKAKPNKPPPKPKPRPSRAALEKAEQAMDAAEAHHADQRAALAKREAELARERKTLDKTQRAERERLEARREKEEGAYQEAMRRWRKG